MMLGEPGISREEALAFDASALPRAFLENPFPIYAALRAHDPIHRNADGSILLTRYADVVATYRNKAMSSRKEKLFGPGPLLEHHTSTMIFRDAPDHTRLRKLISAAFTPRALEGLRPRIAEIVDRLLDEIEDKGECDLIMDFAFALPVEVICEMLDVPKAEREPFRHWSVKILLPLEPAVSRQVIDDGNRAVAEFAGYLKELIAERRRNPSDVDSEILSDLIAAEEDGERLSETELLQNLIFLLNAGHETTANLIGNGLNALFDFPDQLRRLRDNPDHIATAVEECLRFDSPLQLGDRVAGEDTDVGGVAIPKGAHIMMGIGAANHDPDQFPEPHRLDIARMPNRHLAFITGHHACLGATLARMEGEAAIGGIVRRFPRLQRAAPGTRGYRARFRGFTRLPATVS